MPPSLFSGAGAGFCWKPDGARRPAAQLTTNAFSAGGWAAARAAEPPARSRRGGRRFGLGRGGPGCLGAKQPRRLRARGGLASAGGARRPLGGARRLRREGAERNPPAPLLTEGCEAARRPRSCRLG